MARKKKPEEHANHERWLVSYADFITLLFAFFVTMYAISQVDAKKMGKLVQSMRTAFDTQVFEAGSQRLSLSDGTMGGVEQQKLVESIHPMVATGDTALNRMRETIQGRLVRERFVDKVRFVQDKRGLVISLTEAGFFEPGEAELKGSSLIVLDAIAEAVLNAPNQIRIEGHTDNTPIHTERYPSNWELSTARATYIISYLTGKFPFEPHRLSAAGYGEYRPVASNGTGQGRSMNRRVDLVILNEAAERHRRVDLVILNEAAERQEPL
jgi:chemotaxis protein MotB